MPKPWILAVACAAWTLPGCAAQRAEAVARAQAPAAGDTTAVTSTRLITDASSVRLATPGVGATAIAGKPVNATCPVMLGNPVDPKVTAEWKGATVAFCDASARATWTADPSRYAGNLPRLSGSGTDAAPVARRRTPSAARVVAAIPKAPTADAAIGSPDAAPAIVAPRGDGAPMAVAVPVAALGSPDGAPMALPAPRPVTALAAPSPKAAPKAVAVPEKAAIRGPAKLPIAPPTTPVIPLGDDHGDDEECPGGVCRVPGM